MSINNNIKYRVRYLVFLIIPFFFSFIYLKPFLQYPAFNVIDDGASIWLSKEVVKNISNFKIQNLSELLVERNEGRLRPLYHLYSVTIYAFFGASPTAFWIAQTILLSLTITLMSYFLFRTTKNLFLSMISPLALFLFIPTADNFYRLGTAEPKQVLFWLIFLLFCTQLENSVWTVKKMFVGFILLWACFLTKETSLAFVPFFLAFWVEQILFKKQRSSETISYGLSIILSSFIFYFLIPDKIGYGAAFSFNVHDMWLRFVSTLGGIPILYLGFLFSWLGLIVRYFLEWLLYKKISKESKFLWQILLGIQAISLLTIGILPWQWPLSRYFYPLYVIGILAVALEVNAWTKFIPKLKKMRLGWQLFLTNVVFFSITSIQTFNLSKTKDFLITIENIKQKLLIIRLDIAEFWLLIVFTLILIFLRQFKMKRLSMLATFKKYIWHLLFFFYLAVSTFLLSLIWKDPHTHSYFIIELLSVFIFILELIKWNEWNQIEKLSITFKFSSIIGAFIVMLIIRQTVFQGVGSPKRLVAFSFVRPVIETKHNSFDTYQISYGVIDYLLTKLPPDTHIYVFENEFEILYEIGLYASRFGKQSVMIFTHSNQLVEETKNRQGYYFYTEDPVASFLLDNERKILLTRPLWWPQLTSKYNLESLKIDILPPKFTYQSLPENVYWLVAY